MTRRLLLAFWPLVLLALFTIALLREIGIATVLALNETTLRWKALKRDTHPSLEK